MSRESGPDEPIPFITWDGGQFHVEERAKELLRGLGGRPLAVVAVAGTYRTGKSFLLNALMQRPGGFKVGGTVNACTKGIWVWGRPLVVDGKECDVLFMDSEGLSSTSRSESEDMRILALTLLLSSLFIYNSLGLIDNVALSQLGLVVRLTNHIKVRRTSSEARPPEWARDTGPGRWPD